MEKKTIPYDGVITGFGKINGKKVAVYAQDFTVQGGSLGKVHGQKIAELINKAIEARCPVIGINDSGGARIQEVSTPSAVTVSFSIKTLGHQEQFPRSASLQAHVPVVRFIPRESQTLFLQSTR